MGAGLFYSQLCYTGNSITQNSLPCTLRGRIGQKRNSCEVWEREVRQQLGLLFEDLCRQKLSCHQVPGCPHTSPGTLASSLSSCPLALLMDSGPRSAILSGWGSSKAMAPQRHSHKSPFAYLHQFLRFALPCPPTLVLEYWLVTPLILKSSLGFSHN